MPDAINKGEIINIRVEQRNGTSVSFYDVVIQKNGEEYELMVKGLEKNNTYKLPSNKLELLSEMEVSLKELRYITEAKYFVMTITTANKTKSYKVNTDIMHDLITGLKKK